MHEKQKSIFPEISLFPRLARLGRFLTDQCHYPPATHGDHEFPHDPLLSPDLPVTELPNRWDDQGTYMVPDISGKDI